MSSIVLYDLVNLVALLFCLFYNIFFHFKFISVETVFIGILSIFGFLFFLPVTEAKALSNTIILFISLYYTFVKFPHKFLLKNKIAKLSPWHILTLTLISLCTDYLSRYRGWESVMATSMKYWIIYLCFYLWYNAFSKSIKILLITFIILAGIIWGMKVLIASGLILLLVDILKYKLSLKKTLFLVIGTIVVLGYVYKNQTKVEQFLEKSVLRKNYTKDEKIFGLSDGNRLNIWKSYIDGAVVYGKGEFLSFDQVPSHNIFIHILHYYGYFGLAFFGSIFLILLILIYKKIGIEFSCLILLCSSVSSIFEYGSAWVPITSLLPIYLHTIDCKRVNFIANNQVLKSN